MSRASDLRNAVREQLAERLDRTVDSVVVPDYSREELVSFGEPRVFVRHGGRTVELEQGPAERIVTVDVGVAIALGPATGQYPTEASYRAEATTQVDEADGILESIIDLWLPNGPLLRCGLAHHSFHGIDRAVFDASKLYEKRVWLSLAGIQFRDSRDI